jgi:hypothetical protein
VNRPAPMWNVTQPGTVMGRRTARAMAAHLNRLASYGIFPGGFRAVKRGRDWAVVVGREDAASWGGMIAAGVLVVAKAYNHETEGYNMPDDDDPEADEADADFLANP